MTRVSDAAANILAFILLQGYFSIKPNTFSIKMKRLQKLTHHR